MEFESFPKIPRLNRPIIITEKIDGTNGAILIDEDGNVSAQSRNRLIVPGDDNFGFAHWVHSHSSILYSTLGPGRHFGEWWGKGIGRGYGLDHKRFSLFNVQRWASDINWAVVPQIGLYTVPVIFDHVPNQDHWAGEALNFLESNGSVAAPGFMRPEGVIVYHTAGNVLFKATLENDEQPKGGMYVSPCFNSGMEVVGLDRHLYPVAA